MLDFVVRATDGSVDVDASTVKFLDSLNAFVASEAENNAAIGVAVRAVFAKNGEKTISKPELRIFTCMELGLGVGDKSKHDAFDAFLASNPVEFPISAGRMGGVKHVLPKSDTDAEATSTPVEAPAKPKKSRKVA